MRVIDFIVCDDIRQEIGNKVSIMGIFADTIVLQDVPAWPIRMNMAVYVRAELEPNEPALDAYSMTVTCNGRSIAQAHAVAPRGSARQLTFMVHLKPIGIPELGTLDFTVEFLRDGNQAVEPAVYSLRMQQLDVAVGEQGAA